MPISYIFSTNAESFTTKNGNTESDIFCVYNFDTKIIMNNLCKKYNMVFSSPNENIA